MRILQDSNVLEELILLVEYIIVSDNGVLLNTKDVYELQASLSYLLRCLCMNIASRCEATLPERKPRGKQK